VKAPTYRTTAAGSIEEHAFVNQWRLAEAKAALADPAQSATPISTIALDAGFGSLGPFNRAFKADTGLTPQNTARSSAPGWRHRDRRLQCN
jgi:AraC-like DNA-binding protein